MDGTFYEEMAFYTVTRIFADPKYSKEPVGASCPGKVVARNNYNLRAALATSKLKTRYGEVVFADTGNKPGYQAIKMKVRLISEYVNLRDQCSMCNLNSREYQKSL